MTSHRLFLRSRFGKLWQPGIASPKRETGYPWPIGNSSRLTDCLSFAVMRDEGIREALTGDKHLEQAGFAALLK